MPPADASTKPLPWIEASCYDFDTMRPSEAGEILIDRPWPYMARTLWGDAANYASRGWLGDRERFAEAYFFRGSFRQRDRARDAKEVRVQTAKEALLDQARAMVSRR